MSVLKIYKGNSLVYQTEFRNEKQRRLLIDYVTSGEGAEPRTACHKRNKNVYNWKVTQRKETKNENK